MHLLSNIEFSSGDYLLKRISSWEQLLFYTNKRISSWQWSKDTPNIIYILCWEYLSSYTKSLSYTEVSSYEFGRSCLVRSNHSTVRNWGRGLRFRSCALRIKLMADLGLSSIQDISNPQLNCASLMEAGDRIWVAFSDIKMTNQHCVCVSSRAKFTSPRKTLGRTKPGRPWGRGRMSAWDGV